MNERILLDAHNVEISMIVNGEMHTVTFPGPQEVEFRPQYEEGPAINMGWGYVFGSDVLTGLNINIAIDRAKEPGEPVYHYSVRKTRAHGPKRKRLT